MPQPGRAARLTAARRRDGDTCAWCSRALGTLVPATTDHVVPKAKGGPSWWENEVAACRRCNGERGHRGVVEWLEECERRGWDPDVERITRSLESLVAAITERGGRRRARPHLDAQLRRLRKRLPDAARAPERAALRAFDASGVTPQAPGACRTPGQP